MECEHRIKGTQWTIARIWPMNASGKGNTLAFFQLKGDDGTWLKSGELVEGKSGKVFVAGPSRMQKVRDRETGRDKEIRVRMWELSDELAETVKGILLGLIDREEEQEGGGGFDEEPAPRGSRERRGYAPF